MDSIYQAILPKVFQLGLDTGTETGNLKAGRGRLQYFFTFLLLPCHVSGVAMTLCAKRFYQEPSLHSFSFQWDEITKFTSLVYLILRIIFYFQSDNCLFDFQGGNCLIVIIKSYWEYKLLLVSGCLSIPCIFLFFLKALSSIC